VIQIIDAAPDLVSEATTRAWKADARTVSPISAFNTFLATINLPGQVRKVFGAEVDAEFFQIVSQPSEAGRVITASDTLAESEPVAVLSDHLWHSISASNAIEGTTRIGINGRSYLIIGVLPASFLYPPNTDVWVARNHTLTARRDDARVKTVVGRIVNAASAAQITAELSPALRDVAGSRPASGGSGAAAPRVQITSLSDALRPSLHSTDWTILIVSLAVFCLGCINGVGAMLARSLTREREFAVRRALGATNRRLAGEVFAEHTIVVVAAIAMAMVLVVSIQTFVIQRMDLIAYGIPDFRANRMIFVLLAVGAAISATLVALFPVLGTSRHNVQSGLRGGQSTVDGRQRWVRETLVVAEITCALVLLIQGGTIARAFLRTQSLNPGYATEGVAFALVELGGAHFGDTTYARTLAGQAEASVATLPGVTGSAVWGTSYISAGSPQTAFTIEGETEPQRHRGAPILELDISPNFFRVLGIHLTKGTEFGGAGGPATGTEVIVSEATAKGFWPGEDPIGRRFKLGPPDSQSPWLTVIGVSENTYPVHPTGILFVAEGGAAGASVFPQMFRPLRDGRATTPAFQATAGFSVAATVLANPRLIARGLSGTVQQIDPDAYITNIGSLRDYLRTPGPVSHLRGSIATLLFTGSIGLILALFGIYTLVVDSVTQRQREMAIRLSLGAGPSMLVRSAALAGGRSALLGSTIGGVVACWLVFLLRHEVFGISSTARQGRLFGVGALDPATISISLGLVVGTVLVASYVPARAVAHIDPLIILRDD
jgi:predicted permease